MKPLLAILLLGAASSAAAAGQCDRGCIIERVEAYVEAVVAGDVESAGLAADARSTQNGVPAAPGEGVWKRVSSRGSYTQVFVDEGLESAVFFGAFREQTDEGDGPLLLAIRFRFDEGEITELEHLVSRSDWRNRLIDRHHLTDPNPVFEVVLPEHERRTRPELVAIANAYFDGIADGTDEGVPMDPECHRRENGVTLLKNPAPETEPCPIGFQRFNYITDVRDRRVAVVDPARGLVLMIAFFDVPGNIEVAPGRWGASDDGTSRTQRIDPRKIPRSLYIAELFRVVDGRIRDIDAIMFNLDLHSKAGWEE